MASKPSKYAGICEKCLNNLKQLITESSCLITTYQEDPTKLMYFLNDIIGDINCGESMPEV